MGIFGGDDDNGDDESRQARQLQEQQINQNKLELEQKRSSLAQQRINIIKSEGGENWSADRSASISGAGGGETPGRRSPIDSWANSWLATLRRRAPLMSGKV